jgi:hypothetical protein
MNQIKDRTSEFLATIESIQGLEPAHINLIYRNSSAGNGGGGKLSEFTHRATEINKSIQTVLTRLEKLTKRIRK